MSAGRGLPDWSDAPEWAMWRAVDENGSFAWFENRPKIWWGDSWANAVNGEGDVEPVHGTYPADNWRDSLEARPVAAVTAAPLLALPCPFCGGEPTVMLNSVVECRNCANHQFAGYPSAGIAAWNRRADRERVPEREVVELFKAAEAVAYPPSHIGYDEQDDERAALITALEKARQWVGGKGS